MEISKLFGLPAHPLLVHVPIVLIPLCGLGAIAMALHAPTRRRIGLIVAGLTVVAGISTQFAISSGEALRDSVVDSASLRRHVQIADSIRPLVLVLFLAVLALLWLDRRERQADEAEAGSGSGGSGVARPAAGLRIAVAALAVLLAVGTNVRLAQIGHSGAKATWSKVKVESGGG